MSVDTIEEAVVAILKANGTFSAITSRVYPVFLPQNPTLPCVSYVRVSGVRGQDSQSRSNLVSTRMQVDCWATSYSGAKALVAAVRGALGTGPATNGTITLQSVVLDGERDMFESDTDIFRVSLDFSIWHNE